MATVKPEHAAVLAENLESVASALDALGPWDRSSLRLDVGRDGELLAQARAGVQGPLVGLRRSASESTWSVVGPLDDGALGVNPLLEDPHRLLSRLDGRLDRVDRIDCVAHRPGRRAVWRITGDRRGERRAFYLKALRRSAFERARRTHDLLGEHAEAARLALPIDADPESRSLLFAELPGRSLHDLGPLADVSGLVGPLRSWWSGLPDPALRQLEPRDAAGERTSALTMLRRARAWGVEMEELRSRVEEVRLPAEDEGQGWVHGDLHDRQLFRGDGGFSLLDLEGCARGPAWIDAMNLEEHLRLRHGAGERPAAARPGALVDAVAGATVLSRTERLVLRGIVRARLAAVHHLRPAHGPLARELAREALQLLEAPR